MCLARAYEPFPLFRHWQTNFSLTRLLCTQHMWCKCSNTWEAPAGSSQGMLILHQHIYNFLLTLQLLSLTPHYVQCFRDTTMLATRGMLEILFFAVLGIYLSLLRYHRTKIVNNKGTVPKSRERWTCIIIQLSWKNRHGTTRIKACGSCTQGRTSQAAPCSRILRQKQFWMGCERHSATALAGHWT